MVVEANANRLAVFNAAAGATDDQRRACQSGVFGHIQRATRDRADAQGRHHGVDANAARDSAAGVAGVVGGSGAQGFAAFPHACEVGCYKAVTPGAAAICADAAGIAAQSQRDCGIGFGRAADAPPALFRRVDDVVAGDRADHRRSRRAGVNLVAGVIGN